MEVITTIKNDNNPDN